MLKNILRWIALALCALILGLSVYGANASNLLGQKLPMPFGYGAAVVLSGSMEPEMSVGDLIIVKETDTFLENQVVVFEDAGDLVVHRITAIDGDAITTQGDANNVADEPIDASRIKGEVIFTVAGAGAVVEFVKSPVGIVGILVLAALLLELPHRRQKQKDQEELDKLKDEIRKLKDQL